MTTKELKRKTLKEQIEFVVDKLGHGTLFDGKNETLEVLREFDDLVKLVRGINLAFPNTSDSDLVAMVLAQLTKNDKMKLVIKNGDGKKVIKVKEILAEYEDIIVIRK